MTRTLTKRTFKYRFYPTERQAQELLRTFGCVRLVYNKALEAREATWRDERRNVSFGETSTLLTGWKTTEELAFLKDVSSVPLQQGLRHLQAAYSNFFQKRAGRPRFKSRKKSRAAAEYTKSAFRWRDGHLTLAKMSAPLPIVWSRPLPDGADPSSVVVHRDPAGRWFVSICFDAVIDHHPQSDQSIGVDVGIESLLTLSTGEKVANPRHEQRDRTRLAQAQRAHARKTKGSANREKARVKVARIHARIQDRRRDHLHKLTTRLVRENQTIVIEDLNVSGMLRNPSLARAISDASWSEFRTLLEYKAACCGRQVIAIDRWFPSSKTCSTCGAIAASMPLKTRTWNCVCGATHDRDVNAARNILAAGLAVSACGGDVRPGRRESVRLSPVKQEPQPARAELARR